MTEAHYIAAFSNGATFEIISSHRVFTHAWIWQGIHSDGTPTGGHGFAGSAELAARAIASDYSYLLVKPRGRAGRLYPNWKPGQITFSETIPTAML